MGFERLRVYQAAKRLEDEVRHLIALVPKGYAYDVDQLNRAMGSLVYNIPEAYGSDHNGKKRNHLAIARGSSDEVRGVLRRLVQKKVWTDSQIRRGCELTSVIAKMLTCWINRLP